MDYQNTLKYLYESAPMFQQIGSKAYKPGLETTHRLDEHFGHPHQQFKTIHIAGTNGKGSCSHTIAAVLQSAGYRVGLFTSPHLVDFRERIRINGEMMPEEYVVNFVEEHRSFFEPLHPSFFELTTAMAFRYFADQKVDVAVIEVGMGGRLDCTNIIRPDLCVITNIGLDHTQYLGGTLEKIAEEKAGIIKKGVPVFFDGSDERSSRVIEETAENVEAPWYKMEKDALKIQEITDKHIAFSILDEYDNNTVWQVASTGIYQVMNAALAIRAMRYTFGDKAEICKWQKVVASVKWQGRMEEVLPGVIFDGAHNLAAIREFTKSIRLQREAEGEIHPLIILFSAVADKDYSHMIELLCRESKADAYVIAKVDNKRGAQADTLAALFRKYTDRPVYREDTLADAFTRALNEKGSEGKLYCLGSLYLVGELKELIGGEDA